ncbi:MAG: hypothetical protein R3C49_16380 [Planctomycetaceae bacterium]
MFRKFISEPTDDQLKKFAERIDDVYESHLEQFEEGDEDDSLAKSWSSEGTDPEAAIREQSETGKLVRRYRTANLSSLVPGHRGHGSGIGFSLDSDGIYWNLMELATRQLSNRSDQHVVARFGRCPYSVAAIESYEPEEWGYGWWDPYHSMHPPEEVRRLIQEMESLSGAVEASGDDQAIRDYEELMSALEKVSKDNRMLYISVDT